MKINKIQKTNNTFKRGLTNNEILKVKSMTNIDLTNTLNRISTNYNINIIGTIPKTVAFSLEETAKIMKRAGFALPKNFEYTNLAPTTLGCYNTKEDIVYINSSKKAFEDLIAQNKMEESQIGYHPVTGHFLQTYLHEFSHAAHFKHLCEKHGKEKGEEYFWGYLSEKSPSDLIVGPLNAIIKSFCPDCFEKIIDFIFPASNGLYSKTDLTEYFAEKNSRLLAEILGDEYNTANITPEFLTYYKAHPRTWDIVKEISHNFIEKLKDSPTSSSFFSNMFNSGIDTTEVIVKSCRNHIRHTDGDIYHGEIGNLIFNNYRFDNK